MVKKSGQTALILVVITMVTVLGIGAASSTQSNLDLKSTVYSTQSEQAFACAEAGIERALASIINHDPNLDGTVDNGQLTMTFSENLAGGCTYSYVISNDKSVNIPNLKKDMTQQLKYNGSNSNIEFSVTGISNADRIALAVYIYKPTQVIRKFYKIGTSGPGGNFTDISASQKFTLSGSDLQKASVIRMRSINGDISIRASTYPNDVSYNITSTGVAGSVQRTMQVFRYYSQLPGGLDEAVVDF